RALALVERVGDQELLRAEALLGADQPDVIAADRHQIRSATSATGGARIGRINCGLRIADCGLRHYVKPENWIADCVIMLNLKTGHWSLVTGWASASYSVSKNAQKSLKLK